MYRGDIRLGDTIDLKFCTVTTTGAPTTLAGTPVVSAYVGNSVTQITAGITLTVDFDGVTGLHNVRVVASSGNGFATATNVDLVITTGTVGGTSVVGYVIGSFSIENRSAVMPTTAARTLDVSATGEAGVDWANVGSPTTTVGLSGTTVKTATDIATATTAIQADTDDIQARLPAALTANGNLKASLLEIIGTTFTEGAVGRIAAAFKQFFNIATPAATMDHGILVDTLTTYTGNTPQTGDSFVRLGAAGAGLTALGDTRVANLDATISSRATPAQVNTEVVDALAVDTYAEPAQGAPAATTTLAVKVNWLYKFLRNKVTQDATTLKIFADDTTTVDHKATVSDDGTTYTRGEIATGP